MIAEAARLVQQRRKGVADRVSCDAEDAGRLIEMLEPIYIPQSLGGYLSRSGL